MHKPRFTAEASIYPAGSFYAAMETYAQSYQQPGVVQPAFARNCFKVCRGDPDCMQCCMCIASGGKASHCCF